MKRIISIALLICMVLMSAVSCDKDSKDPSVTTQNVEETSGDAGGEVEIKDYNGLLFYDGSAYNLTMVLPETIGKSLSTAFFDLKARLESTIGATIPYKDDFAKANELAAAKNEILVGKTNRNETSKVFETISTKFCYNITVNENGVVILGTSTDLTLQAIEYFLTEYLPKNLVKYGDKYFLNYGTYTSAEETGKTFIEYAVLYNNAGKEFKYTTTTSYMTIPAVGKHKVQQGACCDDEGKYAYFALRNSKDICSLAKYDLKTKELVATKADIGANHANSMCYNSKNNTLIISNCTNKPTYVSIYNADTLELIQHKNISNSNSAITYNAEKDQYVICGGGKISILDNQFRFVKSFAHQPVIYTSQGMHCDDSYIYCIQSDRSGTNPEAKGNVIYVYDWDGIFQFKMELPDISLVKTMEGEDMFHIGTDLYVVCYDQSAKHGVVHKMSLAF